MRGGTQSELTSDALLAAIPDAVALLDADWRVTYVNDAAVALLRTPRAALLGATVWDFPEHRGTVFEREYRRAVAERVAVSFTTRFERLGAWFAVRAVPLDQGLAVFFTDAGLLKQAEQRAAGYAEVQAALRRVATAVAADAPPEDVHRMVCQEAAELVGASGAWLGRYEPSGEWRIIGVHGDGPNWGRPGEAITPPAGGALEAVRRTGATITVAGDTAALFAGYGLHAGVVEPIALAGEVWGALLVAWAEPEPRAQEVAPWLTELAELVSLALGNAEARAELARRATTDPLTGTGNLRRLDEALDQALSRGRRQDSTLTLAVLDVDRFKGVNDGSGHVIGDQVLATVAAVLQEATRGEELVARVGGDEFAILLEGGTGAAALSMLERVRERLGDVLRSRGLPEVTVSAGLCQWERGMSKEALRRRADDALQWAKLHGRDGAWVHDAGLMELPDAADRLERRRSGAVVGPDEVQRRLQSARAFWQSSLDALPQAVAVLDERGEILAVNEAWRTAHGHGVGAGHLAAWEARVGETPELAFVAERLRAVVQGDLTRAEVEYPTGERWMELRAERFAPAEPRRVVVQYEDVTARHAAEERVRFQAQLLDEVDAAVVATDGERRVIAWNHAAERLFGWTEAEAVGRPMHELVPAEDRELVDGLLVDLETHGSAAAELVVHDRHGRPIPVHTRHSVITGPDGRPAARIAVTLDVSERRRYERDLEAARDYLGAVTSSMGDGLVVLAGDGRAAFANQAAADLLGLEADAVPGCTTADLLYAGAAGPLACDDAPARAEDDEFVRADGSRLPVTWTASPLAAAEPGSRVVVFQDATERRERERRLRREAEGLRWAARIRRALDQDHFELLAQPIVDLDTDAVTGFELLLRLRDGARLIGPHSFLPAAEEHDLMCSVDAWVVRRAVDLAAAGRNVHFNLSAQSIGDPSLLEVLDEALAATGAPTERLCAEVTETAVIRSGADAGSFLAELRGRGIGVALDDFGTGYNTFARVIGVPVDKLKIDRAFVARLQDDPAGAGVVRAILALAGELGATVVAEGVEDALTTERLRELGVRYGQGYHLGRPAPLP